MQMKAIVFRLLSILIHDDAPKPMCHLSCLAIAGPLRCLCGCIWSPSFSLPPLRHRAFHFCVQRLHTASTLLDACCVALSYTWPWPQLITQFKFYKDAAWARHFALLMKSAPFAEDALLKAHVLIPIPLSKERLSQRGFNQSLILAQHLSRHQTQSQTLLRLKNTAPQSSLKRSQRLTNLTGAFAVAPLMAAALRGKNILLIDDVMTSGATLNLAASVLKQAGAAHVGALVLAKTPA
jgi:ComF family protein